MNFTSLSDWWFYSLFAVCYCSVGIAFFVFFTYLMARVQPTEFDAQGRKYVFTHSERQAREYFDGHRTMGAAFWPFDILWWAGAVIVVAVDRGFKAVQAWAERLGKQTMDRKRAPWLQARYDELAQKKAAMRATEWNDYYNQTLARELQALEKMPEVVVRAIEAPKPESAKVSTAKPMSAGVNSAG